jgi:cAMP-binding proteins - catabolite gene activator and regulatory subunit of cAMP-dependent protein kinases
MITIDELAKIPLFSTLGESELKYLAGAVEDMRVLPGEYTDHEGGVRALFAIVSGKVELTKVINGVETVIAIRLPGEIAGEIPMTLSTPLPASSARSSRPASSSWMRRCSTRCRHGAADFGNGCRRRAGTDGNAQEGRIATAGAANSPDRAEPGWRDACR